MSKFIVDTVYGHVELKQFYKVIGDKLVNYSYSISYDEEGRELSRTEPTAISSMHYE